MPKITAETPPITAEKRHRRDRPRRAAARLHGLAHAADLQAGRRRRGHRRQRSSAAASRAGCTRSSSTSKQIAQNVSASAAVADARLDVSNRGDRASGSHRRGAREGDRRGAGARSRSERPDAAGVERARNTIETRIIAGLETLGGFGGVADRLNSYNHYLGNPDYLPQDIAALSRGHAASVKAFADEQLQTDRARRGARGARREGARRRTPSQSTPTRRSRRGVTAPSRSTPTRRGASEPPKAGRGAAGAAAGAETFQLPNGLTVILSASAGLPVVAANLVVQTGSDANPLDQARSGELHRGDARRGHGDAQRRSQIADEVAQLGGRLTSGSIDGRDAGAGAVAEEELRPACSICWRTSSLHPSFPAEEVERQRASRLRQLVQQRENDPSEVADRDHARSAVRRRASVRLHRARHRGVEQGMHARRHAVVLEGRTSCRTTPRSSSSGDITRGGARAPGREGVRRLARARRSPRPRSLRRSPTGARLIIVDKPGAPQTRAPRRRDRRRAQVARLRRPSS